MATGDGSALDDGAAYPPLGALPHRGLPLLVSPLAFLYDSPHAMYGMFRAMYCRYGPRASACGAALHLTLLVPRSLTRPPADSARPSLADRPPWASLRVPGPAPVTASGAACTRLTPPACRGPACRGCCASRRSCWRCGHPLALCLQPRLATRSQPPRRARAAAASPAVACASPARSTGAGMLAALRSHPPPLPARTAAYEPTTRHQLTQQHIRLLSHARQELDALLVAHLARLGLLPGCLVAPWLASAFAGALPVGEVRRAPARAHLHERARTCTHTRAEGVGGRLNLLAVPSCRGLDRARQQGPPPTPAPLRSQVPHASPPLIPPPRARAYDLPSRRAAGAAAVGPGHRARLAAALTAHGGGRAVLQAPRAACLLLGCVGPVTTLPWAVRAARLQEGCAQASARFPCAARPSCAARVWPAGEEVAAALSDLSQLRCVPLLQALLFPGPAGAGVGAGGADAAHADAHSDARDRARGDC
jgi:hypothetical protein